jgi:sugar/nucleoside kinase (ribokinase family)
MVPKSVVIIGSATIDTNVREGTSIVQLGGVVTYAGLTFRRHGIDTAVVTNVAEKDSFILSPLSREGIRVYRDRSEKTTRFINRTEGDLRLQEMPAFAEPIRADQFEDVLDDGGHLHIGALHPLDIEAGALRRIQGSRLLTTLDVQGFVRYRSDHGMLRYPSEHLEDALHCASIVKADGLELSAILDYYRLTLSELFRMFNLEELVVTAGAAGGFARTASHVEYPFHARMVENVLNTVGAGDVFFAAYLVHHVYRGGSVSDALEYAAEIAARQIEGRYIPEELLLIGTAKNPADPGTL